MSSELSEAQDEMEAETEKEPYSEDEEAGEEDENTILPHQVAMEQFKDCLAELIVVSQTFIHLITCSNLLLYIYISFIRKLQ